MIKTPHATAADGPINPKPDPVVDLNEGPILLTMKVEKAACTTVWMECHNELVTRIRPRESLMNVPVGK